MPSKRKKSYVKAIDKGLMKVMSKMGISTYQSYCGAQIFEAIGLNAGFVAEYFTGTATQIEGIGLDEVAEEAVRTHRSAFGADPVLANALEAGGEYAWRVRGEEHMWTPESIAKLQNATRTNNVSTYKEYAKLINEQGTKLKTLRGLFEIKPAGTAVPLDEVEPAKEIVKRFATGAMSLGSISTEAHTTLAIAMNRIGGKSNTGEGGEDANRYKKIKGGEKLSEIIGKGRIEARPGLERGRLAALQDQAGARPAASASPPNISPAPTRSRSRWRRARSPARAASCPATRCPSTSPICASRCPASG